jgi:hypothetical protein
MTSGLCEGERIAGAGSSGEDERGDEMTAV